MLWLAQPGGARAEARGNGQKTFRHFFLAVHLIYTYLVGANGTRARSGFFTTITLEFLNSRFHSVSRPFDIVSIRNNDPSAQPGRGAERGLGERLFTNKRLLHHVNREATRTL